MYINTLPSRNSRAPFSREADEGGGGGQGDPGAGGAPAGGKPAAASESGDSWTPPASQEELNKIIDKAIGRTRKQYADYDDVKARAEQFDALAAASKTDQERAAADAKKAGYSEALSKTTPRLVRAEFRAAAQGRLGKEQLDGLLEDLDLSKYVDDDGEPDVDRIEKRVALLAPKTASPSFGQGNRGSAPAVTSMDDQIRKIAGFSRT